MNAKQIKFLQLYENLCKLNYFGDPNILAKFFDNLLALDYVIAVDMWEYFISVYEPMIASNNKLSKLFGEDLLTAFLKNNEVRTVRLLNDNDPVRRMVYQYGTATSTGPAFDNCVNLFAAYKLDQAEILFRYLSKNPRIKFGPLLKSVMEKGFEQIKQKTGAAPKLPRKFSAMLSGYIAKVKTGERTLLVQYLKELS